MKGRRKLPRGLGHLPVYPAIAVSALLIGAASEYSVPVWALMRPLAIAILVLAVALILTRRWMHPAALAIAVAASLLLGALSLAMAFLAVGIIHTAMGIWRRRSQPTWHDLTIGLNAFAVGLLVFTLVPPVLNDEYRLATTESVAVRGQPGPNIYVFVLDGYPRSDTLAGWGHDNGPFLDQLESAGFEVAEESRSNYTTTWLTLTSMADLRHIDASQVMQSEPTEANGSVQHLRLSERFNEGHTWSILRAHGYEVVTTESVFPNLTLYTADRLVGSWTPNAFEIDVIRNSVLTRLGVLQEWIAQTHRDRTREQFAAAAAAAKGSAQPFVFWSHIMSPHAPVLFNADGGPVPHACYPVECSFFEPGAAAAQMTDDEVKEAMTGQVTHVNRLALAAIEDIVASDPEGVIVVMSDHGARVEALNPEFFANFFAVRAPGHPDLFPDDAAATTTMAMLLNAYLDADVPVPDPDLQFVSGTSLLDLRSWSP